MYDAIPDEKDELRQGNIFIKLPWPLFDPCRVIASRNTVLDISTSEFTPQRLAIETDCGPGIILSADCDCNRQDNLVACRLWPITKLELGFDNKSQKNKIEYLLKSQRQKIGVYLLRATGELGESFAEFSELQVFPRVFLERYRHNRVATLSEEARQHFREKYASYRTRFGPDEQYMLSEEERIIAKEIKLL